MNAELLAARVAGAMVGELDATLRAAVAVQDTEQGPLATVSLSRGNRSLGQRQLRAASCEQALAAVVAVTALALSSAPGSAEASGEQGGTAPLLHPVPAAAAPVEPLDSGPSGAAEAAAPGRSLSLSTGVSLRGRGGAALLSLGAALRSGAGEWRAKLWYALPTVVEEEEAVPRRSLEARSERGALALDYCRDAGALGWLALCGGLELGAVRHWQAETLAGQPSRERRWLEPGLTAALGSRLTYPELPWQPAVELTMLLPLLDAAEGRRVGLRAQAGVAVPF